MSHGGVVVGPDVMSAIAKRTIDINDTYFTENIGSEPTAWNVVSRSSPGGPRDCIPTTWFSPIRVGRAEYYALIEIFRAELSPELRSKVVILPYLTPQENPLFSLPEVPLWMVTGALDVFGFIFRKRFHLCIASCLACVDKKLVDANGMVNCSQYKSVLAKMGSGQKKIQMRLRSPGISRRTIKAVAKHLW